MTRGTGCQPVIVHQKHGPVTARRDATSFFNALKFDFVSNFVLRI
jgi:hypothetical protein